MRMLVLLGGLVLLAGCGPAPTAELLELRFQDRTVHVHSQGRFTVVHDRDGVVAVEVETEGLRAVDPEAARAYESGFVWAGL